MDWVRSSLLSEPHMTSKSKVGVAFLLKQMYVVVFCEKLVSNEFHKLIIRGKKDCMYPCVLHTIGERLNRCASFSSCDT